MATETVQTINYQLQLDVGTTQTGGTKHANVSLGRMSLTGFNVQSAADLSLLLQAILDKSSDGEFITRKYTVSP